MGYDKGAVGNCGKLWGKLDFLWKTLLRITNLYEYTNNLFVAESADSYNAFSMFIGEYLYSIDSKKRLSIPAKFRQELGNRAILTRGIDTCLVLYPIAEWEKVAVKLENLPSSQLDARGFARILLSGAVTVELDKLGRILVPDYLKDYARLQKNAAILGLSNRIEIWDETTWQDYKKRTEAAVGDMAERLKELGI